MLSILRASIGWINKGNALIGQGKYDEAIEALDRAVELDPSLSAAWNDKGLALTYQGKPDEAIQAFDKALELKIQPMH